METLFSITSASFFSKTTLELVDEETRFRYIDSNADFSTAKEAVRMVLEYALKNTFPDHVCLNVNIPNVQKEALKGIKVCRQAHAFWEDRFDKRLDQFGKPYFWLTGEFVHQDADDGTDLSAMKAGYASVVPTQFDMTAYATIAKFKKWEL